MDFVIIKPHPLLLSHHQNQIIQPLPLLVTGGGTLRYGRSKTWTVTFTDSTGAEITPLNFTWNVKSDFKITQNITDNKIQLKCTDDKAIDCTFTLQVLDNESNILSEITITIVG